MINLLPPAIKDNYKYARRNVVLRHWASMISLIFIGIALLATYGLLTIHQSITTYNQQVTTTNQQLASDHIDQTESQLSNLTGSLRLAVKVLGQEVLFSKLLTQIGAAMPTGAELTGLDIDQTSGGIDLAAATTNYTTATQVQVNLSDPANQLFSKVDITNITCDSSSGGSNPTHPCQAQYRALFNINNQFLFINQGKSS